jgi:hypothetical protein
MSEWGIRDMKGWMVGEESDSFEERSRLDYSRHGWHQRDSDQSEARFFVSTGSVLFIFTLLMLKKWLPEF